MLKCDFHIGFFFPRKKTALLVDENKILIPVFTEDRY
jgi:hypothetical protein